MTTRSVTIPQARCPFCCEVMEEVQLKLEENPNNPLELVWHEVWQCKSCHTNHIFPARLAFLEYVGKSNILPKARRVIELPI